MAIDERLTLRPERDVTSDGTHWVATSTEPWLTLGQLDPRPFAGRFVTIVYRASAWDEPARPVFRFHQSDGTWSERIGVAPIVGAGLWTGRVPLATCRIDVSPTNRPGRFGFRIESVDVRAWPALLAQGLRHYPRQARSAILTRLIGWNAESDGNLGWAIGATPLDRFEAWRGARTRPNERDDIDRPRFDWTFAPPVRIAVRFDGDETALDKTLTSLKAQIFGGWTARILDGGEGRFDDPRILSGTTATAFDVADADVLTCVLVAGDRLAPTALAFLVEQAHRHRHTTIFYGDEIAGDAGGAVTPVLKPGWSPRFHSDHPFLGRPVFVRRIADWTPLEHRTFIETADLPASLAPGTLVKPLRRILLERKVTAPPPGRSARPAPIPSVDAHTTIVIPTRDHPALLRRVIASIRARSRAGSYAIAVIDNGSVEAETKAHFATLGDEPDVSVRSMPGPFNFSVMCNAAAEAATNQVLLFLNDDTEILTDGWLDRLAAHALEPSTGAVGAKLTYPDGRLQHVGVLVGMGGSAGHFGSLARGDDPGWAHRNSGVHEVSAVTGACLAVAREKFFAVGGFDAEALPVELSDIDLCLKLNARGWQTIVDPAVHLMHEESVSRGRATLRRLGVYEAQRAVFIERWRHVLRDDPTFHPGLSLYRWEAALG